MRKGSLSIRIHVNIGERLNKLKAFESQSYNDIICYLIENEEAKLLQEHNILEL